MKRQASPKKERHVYPLELKQEAVQMLLDGHSASSIVERLGLPRINLLYKWRDGLMGASGPVAGSLETRITELQVELQRVERERDILKKALAYLGRSD